MDVHCSTCNEPWDVYHLWHDAVFETGLSHEEAQGWQQLPRTKRLNERYRSEFNHAGWQFGQSVINVIRCPACSKDAKPNPNRLATKQALLGDNEDGLAATFEDYRL